MSDINKKLREEFKDKEYAHGYMESFCVDRIASQIHTLRKQRDFSQEELSQISGIAQERISKLERGDFSSITMKTLNKLSRAFDVNVAIKFESFSDAVADVVGLNEQVLQVTSRDKDLLRPYLVQLKSSSGGHALPKLTISTTNENVMGYSNFLREKEKLSHAVYVGVDSNDISNEIDFKKRA
jgi:transcriptional regulator with XRE-family HTH domain